MLTILPHIVVCAALYAPPAGTLLQYEGEIVAADDERGSTKEIAYQALVSQVDEKGAHLLWTVSEKGRGAWPWVEQFGTAVVDEQGEILKGEPASVLYEHADGLSPVPLLPPIFGGPQKLADGVSWRSGRLQHEVRMPAYKDAAKEAWQVDVHTAIGPKRTLVVGKNDSVISAMEETVFLGPGKRHRLTLALIKQRTLDADELQRTQAALSDLITLREKLQHETQGGRLQWSEDQLALLKQELPAILAAAENTPLQQLALQAGVDAKLQKGVAKAIENLRDQFVGKTAPALDLKPASLSGTALQTNEIKGQPIVLHLWSYRDNPLVEPYGQIGYLDFLYRKHKADGVQVFGVAVDERLDRPDTRSDAIRSVRKLQSFMNVGYPIVLGDSRVLEQFGDPAKYGAELPLVVVIDADGKIAHYHVGLYEVDQQRGLAELDAVIEKLK